MADMRPFAQRLAQAMPERFWLTVDEPSGNWMCSSVGSFVSNVLTNPASQWAFWGPVDSGQIFDVSLTRSILEHDGWEVA